MKIHCDVCEKDEASLFCTADEAVICSTCDHRVHDANKLAGKHQRFSLHHPSPEEAPLCDICKERRAFLFCEQDRAILCIDCDIPIHKANEHTQRHTRFLLTGIKLSATPSSSCLGSNGNYDKSCDAVSNIIKPEDWRSNTTVCIIAPACAPSIAKCTTFESSSISEYLEMLPGWHVEDLLDFSRSPSSSYGFPKNIQNMENEVPSFIDHAEFQSRIPAEEMGFFFPQVEPHFQYQSMEEMPFDNSNNNNNINNKFTRKINEENYFAVPQFIPQSSVHKRSRTFY